MTIQVSDLRAAERFVPNEPITGCFGSSDVSLLNIGPGGVKISHSHPLRIGTRGRFWFRHGELTITVQARLVWSHLSKDPANGGTLAYHSGLHVEGSDPVLADALQTMLARGVLRQDLESLEKKRQRLEEREKARTAKPTMKIISG